MGLNTPAQLVFLVPDLAAGPYRLEVRSRYEDSGELCIGRLKEALTVH